MNDFDFKITVDNTAQIMAIIDEKADVALKQCGEVIEGYAKEDCPVDTGLLRNSITYALAGQAPAAADHAVYVGTNVEYAPYVEFIDRYHHNVGKAHFLRDAGLPHIDELKEVCLAIFKSI